jgi:hypothetical protein
MPVERISRSEVERALRAADAPEDSMATDDDLLRYEGRAEAVAIMRDMMGWTEWHWDPARAEHHHGTPGECDIPTCAAPRPGGLDG